MAYYYLTGAAHYHGLVPALPLARPMGATLAELAADACAEIGRRRDEDTGPAGAVDVALVPLPAYLARRGLGHGISSHPPPDAAAGQLIGPPHLAPVACVAGATLQRRGALGSRPRPC